MVIRRLDTKAMGCSRLAKKSGASVFLTLGLVLPLLGDAGRALSSDFEKEIAPLLLTRCMECHHPKARSGGLDLSSRAGLLQGGESGPAIDLERPRQSPLLQKVMEGVMPPISRGISQKLPEDEIRKLEQWLVQGMPWPESRVLSLYERTTSTRGGKDWWSLQPIGETRLPLIDARLQEALSKHPIDRFIEPVLIEKGLVPAPKADRETLLRRAYFDLLGLAPDRSEVESFLADQGPDAWERWIDRLLASPRYGERWARYWLDLVRFAETCGYERDQLKPNLWRYRDWVIRSLNRDVPFDRFIAEQLAGDELPDASEETWVATGMLRAGTWNDEPNDPADYLYERIEDLVDVTSTAFLGMTVKCARCHDHKFDPIPQTDYYRMASFFWPGYLGQSHLGGPPKEKLPNNVFGWTDRGNAVDPIHLLIKGDRQRPGEVVEPGFLSMVDRLDRALSPPSPQSSTTGRRLQLAQWISHRDNPLTARVAVNRIWQHHFGQGLVATADNFGFKSAPPTHPALLDWLAATFMAKQTRDDASNTRDALAWSFKRLHRTIMTSEAYQRSSLHPESERMEQRDADNRWLWRFNRRRRDAESLRDCLLAASGSLQLRMEGESFLPTLSEEALEGLSKKSSDWKASPLAEQSRRSIYMMTKRSRIVPMMTAFDFCDTTRPCVRREVTTVAPQALAMMNNDFVHQQSRALATRIERTVGDLPEAQIKAAWLFVLQREPTREERSLARDHLSRQKVRFETKLPSEKASVDRSPIVNEPSRQALASLCHVLLNSNEFLYID